MIKTDGSGRGIEHHRRNNHGDGDICTDWWCDGGGRGHGFGILAEEGGGYGDGYGTGQGGGHGNGYVGARDCGDGCSDSFYVVVLVICVDPITTVYQAHTMQTIRDRYV